MPSCCAARLAASAAGVIGVMGGRAAEAAVDLVLSLLPPPPLLLLPRSGGGAGCCTCFWPASGAPLPWRGPCGLGSVPATPAAAGGEKRLAPCAPAAGPPAVPAASAAATSESGRPVGAVCALDRCLCVRGLNGGMGTG